MAIENIPIRAIITFEDTGIIVATPFILSFNVNKSRGQKGTFSASIKVDASIIENMRGKIHIEAGPKNAMQRIFTGYIRSAVPSPAWDDPAFFVVNISGVDELFKLEHKKFTRRQLSNDTSWAIINNVISQGTMKAKLKFTNNSSLVSVADKQTLRGLVNYNPEKEKSEQEPKLDTNAPKNSIKPHQRLEATIGYTDLNVDKV